MLDITILAIGQLKDRQYQALFSDYLKRLRPYARLKVVELPSVPFAGNNQVQAKNFEAETIENFLLKMERKQSPAAVYLLAERGQNFSSPEFAAFLNKKQPLILIVGGALGFSDRLYAQYPQISLSPLTFPHELARVVLAEQIYRATTIINKKIYHY
ncbi:MAG: 23S rRNA (pseudouridine(1915)-N(3))-methyltransferase RlmH [Patescibacteria group bacterium]